MPRATPTTTLSSAPGVAVPVDRSAGAGRHDELALGRPDLARVRLVGVPDARLAKDAVGVLDALVVGRMRLVVADADAREPGAADAARDLHVLEEERVGGRVGRGAGQGELDAGGVRLALALARRGGVIHL